MDYWGSRLTVQVHASIKFVFIPLFYIRAIWDSVIFRYAEIELLGMCTEIYFVIIFLTLLPNHSIHSSVSCCTLHFAVLLAGESASMACIPVTKHALHLCACACLCVRVASGCMRLSAYSVIPWSQAVY